jgi:hypothetical protein
MEPTAGSHYAGSARSCEGFEALQHDSLLVAPEGQDNLCQQPASHVRSVSGA